MRREDPLILGAGPAGCAAAIVLAESGARPLLLDRDKTVSDPLCGGFLSWRTAAGLSRLGIDCDVLGAAKIERLVLFAGNRESQLALPAPAYALSRRALDGALRERARQAGARIEVDTARSIEGTRVIGQARIWEGNGLFLATGKHDIRGAGRTRASDDPALGLRVRLPPSPRLSTLLAGRIELHLFAGGYAGIVLQEDGSANVCLALRKSRLLAAGSDPRALLASLAGRHPRFAERLEHGWEQARIDTIGAVPYGWIARDAEPQRFRLGDQAAVIPSLAGEGIGIALASGTMAASFWRDDGASGAEAYQHAFAARARPAVALAGLAWRLAESPAGAHLSIGMARAAPSLLRALSRATRIG